MNQETPGQPDSTLGPAPLPSAPHPYPYPVPPGYPATGGSGLWYPPPGYPPPGYSAYPGPGAPRRELNGAAIASLVLAVLGGVLFSVVLGLIALSQIARRSERGRGLAIAGLSISAVWVAIFAVVATVIVSVADDTTADSTTATRPAATTPAPVRTGSTSGPGRRAVEQLALGDCLSYVDENSSPEQFTVKLCRLAHGGEVYDIWSLPAGSYPGDAKVQEQADNHCDKALQRYATGKFADAGFLYVYPNRVSWPDDRKVVCIAVPKAGQWTGSMVHP